MNINLNLKIFSQGAQLGLDFIPIIGQHGINLKNFCDEFNNLTLNIHKGFLLRVCVIINKNKTFIIKFKGIDLNFLIKYLIGDKKKITIYQFYILSNILLEFNNLFNIYIDIFYFYLNLINKLKIYKIEILY